MTNGTNSFENIIDELIENTEKVFSIIIEKTKTSDQKSKTHKDKWTKRHRLHVLLEAAQETKRHLPTNTIAPWFLAELKATLELIKRWNCKPIWKNLEPSLVDSNHFNHTIVKLHLIEHLQKEGHKVKIIPKGKTASPDLMIKAIGGTEDWINIEVFRPKILDGGSVVNKNQIKGIVKKSMKKAKRQLEKKTPGILAICGFNQPKVTQEYLKKTLSNRLKETERSHLCGIMTLMLGILYREEKIGRTFTPIKTIDFVPNPNYFGRVDVIVTKPQNDPHLIRIPLKDARSDAFITRRINQLSKRANYRVKTVSNSADHKQNVIKQKLKLVQKPKNKTRVLIETNNKTLPIFKGDGNVTSICGNCDATLVERAWKLSLNNIVFRCPFCRTYSEIPKLQFPEHPILGYIKIMNANYNFSKTVILKRGATLVGE